MPFPIHAKFMHPDNGYPLEQKTAREHLEVGKVYTIQHMDVGQSSTRLYFYEVPLLGFNSVMFDSAEWFEIAKSEEKS